MSKKYARGIVPPCPGNPQQYALVNRHGFYYWRLKRGSLQPALLNTALQLRADAMKALSPVIKQLRLTLLPIMAPLPAGTLHNNLFKWLQQTWIATGLVHYQGMKDRELHDKYTLKKILQASYRCTQQQGYVQLHIPACAYAVKRPGRLATEFVLEGILVWGGAQGFETKTETSPVYNMDTGIHAACMFEWELPAHRPWFLLLRLACFEGSEWAKHPAHYGVRVVEAGRMES